MIQKFTGRPDAVVHGVERSRKRMKENLKALDVRCAELIERLRRRADDGK